MDIIETPQNESEFPGEAAGYPLAGHPALREVPEEWARVPQSELLVNLQAVETDDKGMWDKQEHLVPFKPPWVRYAGFEQGRSDRECKPGSGTHEHSHYAEIL